MDGELAIYFSCSRDGDFHDLDAHRESLFSEEGQPDSESACESQTDSNTYPFGNVTRTRMRLDDIIGRKKFGFQIIDELLLEISDE